MKCINVINRLNYVVFLIASLSFCQACKTGGNENELSGDEYEGEVGLGWVNDLLKEFGQCNQALSDLKISATYVSAGDKTEYEEYFNRSHALSMALKSALKDFQAVLNHGAVIGAQQGTLTVAENRVAYVGDLVKKALGHSEAIFQMSIKMTTVELSVAKNILKNKLNPEITILASMFVKIKEELNIWKTGEGGGNQGEDPDSETWVDATNGIWWKYFAQKNDPKKAKQVCEGLGPKWKVVTSTYYLNVVNRIHDINLNQIFEIGDAYIGMEDGYRYYQKTSKSGSNWSNENKATVLCRRSPAAFWVDKKTGLQWHYFKDSLDPVSGQKKCNELDGNWKLATSGFYLNAVKRIHNQAENLIFDIGDAYIGMADGPRYYQKTSKSGSDWSNSNKATVLCYQSETPEWTDTQTGIKWRYSPGVVGPSQAVDVCKSFGPLYTPTSSNFYLQANPRIHDANLNKIFEIGDKYIGMSDGPRYYQKTSKSGSDWSNENKATVLCRKKPG